MFIPRFFLIFKKQNKFDQNPQKMSQKKSIKQVILVGQLIVNVPVMLFMFGLPCLTWYLFLEGWLLPISAILGFALAWTWWSFSIVFWRIWAFTNTSKKDWSHLETTAIDSQLIWPEGHFFEKTEIRTKAQQEKIHAIHKEIEQHSL